jgi:hypothetical protein
VVLLTPLVFAVALAPPVRSSAGPVPIHAPVTLSATVIANDPPTPVPSDFAVAPDFAVVVVR